MLRKKYGDQVDFAYINISTQEGRDSAFEQGFRLGTPQILLHDGDGELVRQWHGPVTFKEVEPIFISMLSNSS